MRRTYIFKWYANKDKRYGEPTIREHSVFLSAPTGRTEIDAKNALSIFMSEFGNLRKNSIVSIKEMGENGQIGEDIVPSADENAIIPVRK